MKVIAEIGINHLGSTRLAKDMINAGNKAGVKYFKFQIYKTEEWGIDQEFKWYDYIKHCELSPDDFKSIKDHCDKIGVVFFASVFGEWSFNLAESLHMPLYKIASRTLYDSKGNISDTTKKIISTGKPVIASLGFKKEEWEIPDLPNTKILYCVSKYPTTMEDITWPKFGDKIHGFSDHTIGTEAAKKAYDLGASILEKHFTVDKKLYGPDQACSATPQEFKEIIEYGINRSS